MIFGTVVIANLPDIPFWMYPVVAFLFFVLIFLWTLVRQQQQKQKSVLQILAEKRKADFVQLLEAIKTGDDDCINSLMRSYKEDTAFTERAQTALRCKNSGK